MCFSLGACSDVCGEHSNLVNGAGTQSTSGCVVIAGDSRPAEVISLTSARIPAIVPKGPLVSGSGAEADSDVPEIVLHPPSAPESEEEDNYDEMKTEDNIDDVRVIEPSGSQVHGVKSRRVEVNEKNVSSKKNKIEMDPREKDGDGSSDEQEELPPLPDVPPECLIGEDDVEFPAPPPDPDEDLITFAETEREKNENEKELQHEEEKEDTETENDGGCEMVWKVRQPPGGAPQTVPPRKISSTASAQSVPGKFTMSLECECERLGRPEQAEDRNSKSSLFYDPSSSNIVIRPSPIVITANRNGPAQSAIAITRSVSNSGVVPGTEKQSNFELVELPYRATNPLQNFGTLPSVNKPCKRFLDGGNESTRQRPRSAVNMDNSLPKNNHKDAPALVPPVIRQRATSEGRVDPTSTFHPEPLFHEQSAFKRRRPQELRPLPNLQSTGPTRSAQDDSIWVPLAQRFQLDDVGTFSEPDEPFQRRRPRPKTAQNVTEITPPKFRAYTPQPKPSRKHFVSDVKSGNETCV